MNKNFLKSSFWRLSLEKKGHTKRRWTYWDVLGHTGTYWDILGQIKYHTGTLKKYTGTQ